MVWAFWIAAALAAVGGLAPAVFAGFSSRINGAIIPFWIAAIALGACARYYDRGRPLVTGLYFIAGLAIVYGFLQMLSLPLRLTMVGTCPPAPAHCLPGLEQPMTEGETTGFWFAIGMGVVAIFVGYFGLYTAIRRRAPATAPAPPVRSIPPVETAAEKESKPVETTPEKEPKPADPAPPTAGTE